MTGVDKRFLLADDKARIVADWEHTKERWRKGIINGAGEPDADIIPWCDRLNELPGVCTLQSCVGHETSGHLWLWLDEQRSREFDRWGYVLARMEGIETVNRKYGSWGQEITAIEFDGRFEKACESVLLFFRALSNCGSRYQVRR